MLIRLLFCALFILSTVLLTPVSAQMGPGDKTVDLRAEKVKFAGRFVQGGMVAGITRPGTKIFLEGAPIRVSKEGWFVMGFGRDAKRDWQVDLEYPDGSKETTFLNIDPRNYIVQRIDGLPSRKVTPSKEDIAKIKKEVALIKQVRQRNTPQPYFNTGFVWPVTGPFISGVYGSQRILNGKPKSPHRGVDIPAPEGTPIKAAGGGVVALAYSDMFYTGHTVMIDHGHGLTSVYAHLNKMTVDEGDVVNKGDVIGEVGATGRATAPHLHWGVAWFDRHLDPELLVPPMPGARRTVNQGSRPSDANDADNADNDTEQNGASR